MTASAQVEEAARAVADGGVIVLPTDTVYGIGTRPDDVDATARLFAAKGRPRDLELPVLVPSPAAARAIAVFDGRAVALVERAWPGPLTVVLPRADASRGWDLGGDAATIGVRMPRHPVALAVLERTGPLAVTSANRSGDPPAERCADVVATFGDVVALYLCEDEPLRGAASTVVDLAHGEPRILRAGAVSLDEVREAMAGSGPTDDR